MKLMNNVHVGVECTLAVILAWFAVLHLVVVEKLAPQQGQPIIPVLQILVSGAMLYTVMLLLLYRIGILWALVGRQDFLYLGLMV